jgi:hypothetical protein
MLFWRGIFGMRGEGWSELTDISSGVCFWRGLLLGGACN